MRQDLPEPFRIQMQELLGGEYDAYLRSFDAPPAAGLRVNTAKWTPAGAAGKLGVPLRPVTWTDNGFYYNSGRLSKDPYYYAGLYYLQEPSAMAPARFLPVKPGDRVLDLCAAPGGKSTELGARLKGRGLLWANDISNSRAKALLKNLELFGIANICVSSEGSDRLAQFYPEYFDSVLVDAPCSGEGMFRREPDMVKDWTERGPEYYAPVQAEILMQAVKLLRPGGYLMYSTCTFSRLEDEGNVLRLLEEHPEMELVPLERFAGACGGIGLEGCLRLFPYKVEGEGHFLALMRKKMPEAARAETLETVRAETGNAVLAKTGNAVRAEISGHAPAETRGHAKAQSKAAEEPSGREKRNGHDDRQSSELAAFLSKCRSDWDERRFLINGESVYYLPDNFTPAKGIRYLRTGLFVGSLKNGRFEPSQALAMTLNADTFADSISFEHEDERVVRYLKGETVFLREDEPERQGWQLICVDGYGLGFVKAAGRTLKNKYYPGWRWM